MSTLKRRWWVLLFIPIVALGAVVFWAESAPDPMPEALAALQPDAHIDVLTSPWLIFQPLAQAPTTGLILYPGGRVDPRAYAPAARDLAAQGHLVAIVPMPLHLAVLAPDRASDVMAAFPEVRRWAVGGHSLGGAMAARFADQNPSAVQGLVLWASYPAASNDLSAQNLAVTSVYGTLDGLATVDDITASRPLLPADTRWVAIEGGNHAQFGWYGPQTGDGPAAISRQEQQRQIVASTLELLSALKEGEVR